MSERCRIHTQCEDWTYVKDYNKNHSKQKQKHAKHIGQSEFH